MKIGDTITRIMGGAVKQELKITEITDTTIICGSWTFDKASGAEIDPDLDWGPPPQMTGSYIQEIAERKET